MEYFGYKSMPEQPDIRDYFKPIGSKTKISVGMEGTPYSDATQAVVERLLKKPVVINMFTDEPDTVFDSVRLQDYLRQTFGPNFTVINHEDLINYALEKEPEKKQEIIRSLAKANFARKHGWSIPVPEEERVKLEEEAIERDHAIPFREFARKQREDRRYRISRNDYYAISDLGEAYSRMIPQNLRIPEEDKRKTFLIITGRGIGERMEQGIHLRAGFAHRNIAVVSTTGLVDAPGKPLDVEKSLEQGYLSTSDRIKIKEFEEELQKRGNAINGTILEEILEKIYADKMLHHEDPRINEAVKGITLSMILFTLGEYGRPGSCSTTDLTKEIPDTSKFCRMHDAHWQEELIATQIQDEGQPEFCDYHVEIFRKLK